MIFGMHFKAFIALVCMVITSTVDQSSCQNFGGLRNFGLAPVYFRPPFIPFFPFPDTHFPCHCCPPSSKIVEEEPEGDLPITTYFIGDLWSRFTGNKSDKSLMNMNTTKKTENHMNVELVQTFENTTNNVTMTGVGDAKPTYAYQSIKM
ncbi:uncharacterized protein LOC111056358 isoform X2 [Nilaparvata lugens]|uniref:uncharacterized protein LOC111056358 isoform X2 n=1 Tax=Nilaparvata lugens TaxID=108931 RepID=UPI00193DDF6A|nr:uncharacterized protein LOC111056358 isoform X2 [Nilaparvata lugens]